MTDVELTNETPISLVEMREDLMKLKKRDKELNFRANKTLEYLTKITKSNLKEVLELKDKLGKLDIGRLKEKYIIKIVDILPKDLDSLRAVFAGEGVTLKQEDLNKILETVKPYT